MTAVFLDFDGTLIDCRRRHDSAYRRALLELGSAPLDWDVYWARRLDGAANVDLIDAAVDRSHFTRLWLDFVEAPELLALDERLAGATQALAELREAGMELVLLTMRRRREALLTQLDGLDLRRFLSRIVCHGDAPRARSKADLMRIACHTRDGDVVVGDSEADVEAARAHGLQAVAVAGGVRSRAFLEALQPDAISPTIGDLPSVLRAVRCGAPTAR